jgi:glycerol-3-phosphate dehydrogenase
MRRTDHIARLEDPRLWDLVIIGGGATGLGIAVDAAARGYAVCMLEAEDFAKGTSSRSTKLVHGGVRYLQQGNISLVMEALHERGVLRNLAPHLVHELPFVVPNYQWWESPFYGIGLKVYDLLAGRYGFGRSQQLSAEETIRRIPNVDREGLRGGVLYHDGQFDDARLAINLAQTAAAQGAVVVNRMRVTAFLREEGEARSLTGVVAEDRESGRELRIRGKVVVNAAGPFADDVRRLLDPAAPPMIAPSRGAHLVLDRQFLDGDTAIMVPHTSDGRVMFAVPWHHVVVLGTTDTPVDGSPLEPRASPAEIDFILETSKRYLHHEPSRADVRSVFAGIRPLVKLGEGHGTAALSRDHTIHIDGATGLMTIAGGKWTTYRRMAQDLVDQAATLGDLPHRPCVTTTLNIRGWRQPANLSSSEPAELHSYGADAPAVAELARRDERLAGRIHPRLPVLFAQIAWAVREEMALTLDDVLARRTRALLFDADATCHAAPAVAALLAEERGLGTEWASGQVAEFLRMAEGYLVGE